jgi:alpha-beta hydrolase superfamily lysophospholipase
MGGCIAAHLAINLRDECDALMLFAPMLSVEKTKKENKNLLKVSAFLDKFIPTAQLGKKSANPDPDLDAEFAADPDTYKEQIRVRFGLQSIRGVDECLEHAHQISCPLFIMHSPVDITCDPEGSATLMQLVSSTDKTLCEPKKKDMNHAIMVERGNQEVHSRTCEWLTSCAKKAARPAPQSPKASKASKALPPAPPPQSYAMAAASPPTPPSA